MTDQPGNRVLKIAMLAGEASGDILGAGLIAAIKKKYPHSEFFGVGGERMQAQGFTSWYPMDRLAVMGLIEPLKRIFELLAMRRNIRERLLASPPDVFIGIDAPDFNLSLEVDLRKAGIKVAHYVSPSVWAWRQGRIKKIKRAVDLMLTLFPFEEDFYQQHEVPVCCVGHTLADEIPLKPDSSAAREKLNAVLEAQAKNRLDFQTNKTVGLLPGSRASEVRFHTRLFLQAAKLCWQQNKSTQFVIPAANEKRFAEIQTYLQEFPELPVTLVLKHSHEIMAACDALLIASGTTALEAMLLKRPTLISYKMSDLAFNIFKRIVTVKFVGLPNLLAGRSVVPELLQRDATPEKLASGIQQLLSPASNQDMLDTFHELHLHLRRNANERAAQAVLNLLESGAQA